MPYLDVYEQPETRAAQCLICGAGPQDSHWSMCPAAPEGTTSDDDMDADESIRSIENL
jgi:hypothetical protein